MTLFLLLLATLAFALNLNAPAELSDVPAVLLILEYIGVLAIANILIRKGLHAPKDIKIRYMNCFLIGFTISLLFLYFVWTPGLPESSRDWGFDPQRYYLYSSSFVRGDFVVDSLNYFGVVFFYVVVFFIFGIDPLTPLFVNSLLTLSAVVVLSNHLGCLKKVNFKYFSFLLLIPEVVYFNVIPSREIICMSLATISIVKGYDVLNAINRRSSLFIFIACLLILIVVRPPMGAGVVGALILYMLVRGKFKKIYVVYIGAIGLLMFLGLRMSSSLDYHDGADTGNNLSEAVAERFGGENDTDAMARYTSNSVAQRLIPHNPVEFVVYGIIRSFAYVVISPGIITTPEVYFELTKPTTEAFESLTTILMMLFLPITFKNIKSNIKSDSSIKVVIIALLFFFFLVGVFNVNIIHQRYRVVYDLFYFSIAAYYFSMRNQTLSLRHDTN